MISLLCTDPRHVPTIRAVLPSRMEVREAAGWRALELARPLAACSVVVAEWLRGEPLERLAAFKSGAPYAPVVLVTARDADNVRALKDVRVEEVVWLREVGRELVPAISRARGHFPLFRVARAVEGAAHLPPTLRTALVRTCTRVPPVTSVAALAAAAGCDRTTLSRQWRRAAGPAAGSLDRVLQWIVLLRALEIRACGRKWAAVAAETGVHPHTLSRIAARLVGAPLQKLAEEGTAVAYARFDREVMCPLLGEAYAAKCAEPPQTVVWGEARE